MGLDLPARRPAEGNPADRRFVLGIDSAFEEDLVIGIDPALLEPSLDERIDVEGGQVPLVEADRVAQRDGARLVGAGNHAVEELPRAPPVAVEPVHASLTIELHHGRHHANTGPNRC